MSGCQRCDNGHLFFDFFCINGVIIDIDEYTEGAGRDVVRTLAPCHPKWCAKCEGSGMIDIGGGHSVECAACDGSGATDGNNDSIERIESAREADEAATKAERQS